MKAKDVIGSFVDGSGRLVATITPAERQRRRAENAKRAQDIEDSIGHWPDPAHPGVPLHPERNGVHWLRWPQARQALAIGEWSADLQMWVVCYLGCFTKPDEMDHLNYICEAEPPGPWILPE